MTWTRPVQRAASGRELADTYNGPPDDRPARHPLIPPREVDARQELPELEQEVLERWRERDVFGESLRNREGAEQWVFYEGPPTANGRPGSHHVLSRVFKDIYPRYKTMRGYRVERKGGWDCHGLPVEIAVEQKLGIKSKTEIEQYGIKEFNEQCRNSVFEYLEEWDRLTERIGFWVDLEHAYRTLDESYIESVWWALTEITTRGCCTRGTRWCPTATAAARPSPRTRWRSGTRTWSIRRCMCVCRYTGRCGPLQAGRRAADLDDDAVDAAGQRRGGRRAGHRVRARRSWTTRRWSSRGARRASARRRRTRSSTAFPGRD